MLDLIVCQGRVGDRSTNTIEGAARTAEALERCYGAKARVVGTPTAPARDSWRNSLPQARETLAALSEAVAASIGNGKLPVMVANTCSASLASLPVVARTFPDAVVLWIDAHGDFNTPYTTDTSYLGGMVLAAACGLWDSGHGTGLRPEQTILVGARDIDVAEGHLLRQSGVRVISPEDATPEMLLATIGGADVWIHIDWDVLQPGFVPADYDVPGGLLPAQLRQLLAAIPSTRVLGVEVAEFHSSRDEASNAAPIATILETLSPILAARRCRDGKP
jgi:arginase family enzyme